jgi:hypothetical protein
VRGAGILLVALVTMGCGVMGPPVPPNSIGVNVKRENDKRLEQNRALANAKVNKDRDPQSLLQAPTDQAPSFGDTTQLEERGVDPAARANDDYLVRPR